MAAADRPAFVFPKAHEFPPMFTLQPNMTTRAAQLDRWSDMVRAYCAHHRLFRLATRAADASGAATATATAPAALAHAEALFHNARINRRLNAAGVRAVMAHMVSQGSAEAAAAAAPGSDDADGPDVFFVWWRAPEDWAILVQEWVDAAGLAGSVVTLHEMTDGDAALGSELAGLDADVLRRALAVLERQRRAQVISSAGGDLGVKFFSV